MKGDLLSLIRYPLLSFCSSTITFKIINPRETTINPFLTSTFPVKLRKEKSKRLVRKEKTSRILADRLRLARIAVFWYFQSRH